MVFLQKNEVDIQGKVVLFYGYLNESALLDVRGYGFANEERNALSLVYVIGYVLK